MANQEHLNILNKGVETWNQWQRNWRLEEHVRIQPDLREADLREADLSDANLGRAVL